MPKLTIIVVVYNMRREAPRTLLSLSPEHQRGVDADDYEVLVVDNGSREPLGAEAVKRFGPSWRYLYVEDPSASPAAAMNLGLARTESPYVGLMIDGARLVTPGAVREALLCLEAFERPVVATLGFHLGPELQSISLRHGYDAAAEDRLLDRVAWRDNGYRLFEIAALAGSSRAGTFHAIDESNLLFLPRGLAFELGGFDERFDLPGGGMVNLDFYGRACALPRSTLVTLLSEATFHQIHGGAQTGKPLAEADEQSKLYGAQYTRLRGAAYRPPERRPIFFGQVRPEVLPWLEKSSELVRRLHPEPPASAARAQALPPELEGVDDADGATAFNLLGNLGLRQHHRLFELGCGALKAGRLFIAYLLPGHYHAVEPDSERLRKALSREFGEQVVARKVPRFVSNRDFNLELLGTGFDFILAQSIFSHTGYAQLGQCLTSARRALGPRGLLVATFFELEHDRAANVWVEPGLNAYSFATLARICAACGLHCRKIDWPHPLETWFVAASDRRRVEAVLAGGIDLLPDELVLTHDKRRALDAGAPMGFYRGWKRRRGDATRAEIGLDLS